METVGTGRKVGGVQTGWFVVYFVQSAEFVHVFLCVSRPAETAIQIEGARSPNHTAWATERQTATKQGRADAPRPFFCCALFAPHRAAVWQDPKKE